MEKASNPNWDHENDSHKIRQNSNVSVLHSDIEKYSSRLTSDCYRVDETYVNLIIIGEEQLRRILRDYLGCYHNSHPH